MTFKAWLEREGLTYRAVARALLTGQQYVVTEPTLARAARGGSRVHPNLAAALARMSNGEVAFDAPRPKRGKRSSAA